MDFTRFQNKFLGLSNNIYTKVSIYIVLFILAIGLGSINFTLYHTTVELFCIVIGFVMAIISINTYKLNGDNRIIFLGMSFGFIASIDLFHLFAYKEMNISNIFTFNMSIQLWVVARYMQSITLLISFISRDKRYNFKKVSFILLVISIPLLISIFYLKIFPDCYIEGVGFTFFKSITGYINCIILFIGLVYFIKQNKGSKRKYDTALKVSIAYSIVCELLFIFTTVTNDMASTLGHMFQLLSFYYIYIALVRSSLQEPHYSLIKLNNILTTKNQHLKSLVNKFKSECEHRKDLEVESQSKKQILNAILESVVDGILVINDDIKVVHFNNQFIKMLNIPFEITSETTNNEIIDFIKKQIENPEEFETHIKREWEKPLEYIKYIHLKSGKVFEISSVPFINNNTVNGRLIIYRDVTEKRKIEELQKQLEIRQASLEKAREFDEIKTNFFCTVSHELKTPINIILGVIQLVSRGNKSDIEYIKMLSSAKYINMMKQNCYRLIKLSNNLIDITKIDAGYTEMNIKNHNIISVIEDITLSVAEYTRSKDISLVFDTDTEEKFISCDDEQLERVMLNLLSNAIKFTNAKGTIEVNIKDKEDFMSISVKDSGIGIPEDKADIVFDRFRQVESTLRGQKEGSGIGLALVKSIVEKHGGKISLESELGKGSEFIIELPVKLVTDSVIDELIESKEMNVDRINIEFSDIYELNIY